MNDGQWGRGRGDALIRAIATYVEALHARYPEGPDQMRREALDSRAKITLMPVSKRNQAA